MSQEAIETSVPIRQAGTSAEAELRERSLAKQLAESDLASQT